MDNMDKMELDGFDEVVMEEAAKQDNIVPMSGQRVPYASWTVDGVEYKLKLTASVIVKLEQRYKRNLLLLVTEDGLPPISVMLTVIQAGLQQHHHGITYAKVQELYDCYIDEGGDQQALMADIMLPLLAVSGFFTQAQAEAMSKEMKEIDSNL